jgi:hypothetical protein
MVIFLSKEYPKQGNHITDMSAREKLPNMPSGLN